MNELVVISNPYKELRKALKAHKGQKRKLKLIKRTKDCQEPAPWAENAIDTANAALDLYEAEIRELCQLIGSTDHE